MALTVVSILNYKGGVGKTTLTANLAAKLAACGKSVLMIDLDPQASLTFSFVPEDVWKDRFADARTIKRWFDAFLDGEPAPELATLVVSPEGVRSHVAAGRLDLICSHLNLINVNNELYAATVTGHANPRQYQRQFLRVMGHLRLGLAGLQDTYDYVLIDCPPDFSTGVRLALVASDWYLVPATPDFLSTLGIQELRKHVTGLIDEFNQAAAQTGAGQARQISPGLLGIVFTMVVLHDGHPIQAQTQFITQLQQKGIPTFATQLRENRTAYALAPDRKVPVAVSRATNGTERAVLAEWSALATEFLRRTGAEDGPEAPEAVGVGSRRPLKGAVRARWGLW